jgi:hypothetical protein
MATVAGTCLLPLGLTACHKDSDMNHDTHNRQMRDKNMNNTGRMDGSNMNHSRMNDNTGSMGGSRGYSGNTTTTGSTPSDLMNGRGGM